MGWLLGSAFFTLRWFKLAGICIRVTSLHKRNTSESICNFFYRKSISCKCNSTHTQSWKQSRRHGGLVGGLVGLALPNRKCNTTNKWNFGWFYNVKSPRTKAPPYWKFSGDGSAWKLQAILTSEKLKGWNKSKEFDLMIPCIPLLKCINMFIHTGEILCRLWPGF